MTPFVGAFSLVCPAGRRPALAVIFRPADLLYLRQPKNAAAANPSKVNPKPQYTDAGR
jgi:hypothetical protein